MYLPSSRKKRGPPSLAPRSIHRWVFLWLLVGKHSEFYLFWSSHSDRTTDCRSHGMLQREHLLLLLHQHHSWFAMLADFPSYAALCWMSCVSWWIEETFGPCRSVWKQVEAENVKASCRLKRTCNNSPLTLRRKKNCLQENITSQQYKLLLVISPALPYNNSVFIYRLIVC